MKSVMFLIGFLMIPTYVAFVALPIVGVVKFTQGMAAYPWMAIGVGASLACAVVAAVLVFWIRECYGC